MSTNRKLLFIAAAAVFGGACGYDEDALDYFDIQGEVRIPVEAAQITITVSEVQEDGTVVETDKTLDADIRNLGPVYLGVYPSVDYDLFDYPHPEIGPVLSNNALQAYPYGGTSVGRPDFACYQALRCKVTTGRFKDYDDILQYFAEELETPIENSFGEEVTSGLEYREWCYETMWLTSDSELPFIAGDDLDFERQGDYFVADATIYHTYFEEGAAVWGWMDAPSRSYNFASCDDTTWGWNIFWYDQQYNTGATTAGLLNNPDNHIDLGDWIVEEPATLTDPENKFTVDIGFHYE